MSAPLGDLPGAAITVVGSTATGKSGLALGIAAELGLEILNGDALQLYRGMDIGTAKLPPRQRRGVPHHLLDVLEVTEEASVARYQAAAREVLARLPAPGVVVGGSGLYIRSIVDDLEFPGHDPEIRARLERRAEAEGPGVLYAELRRVDPASAERIPAGNVRRVIRALEVFQFSGRPFSATLPSYRYVLPTVQIGLRLDREALDRRIDLRVQEMWEAGLVDEVRSLESRGLRRGGTARRALGYAQVLEWLDGSRSEEWAREETAAQTRRFARRQETWFYRDERIHWLDAALPEDDLLAEALGHIRAAPGIGERLA